MRIALFGGTFDPPHRGHIALARLARERLSLDRILVAPVAVQPLKHEMTPTSFDDRVAMTRLAFAREPGVEISLLDAPRPDGRSNYTMDSLAALRQQLKPADALFCILGADSFLTIGNWHRSADLLTSCDFIVGARPGFDLTRAHAALPKGVTAKSLPTELPNTQLLELKKHEIVAATPASHLYLLMDLAEDVSATEIRAALHGDTGAARILNPRVAKYTREHHLYAHL